MTNQGIFDCQVVHELGDLYAGTHLDTGNHPYAHATHLAIKHYHDHANEMGSKVQPVLGVDVL